MVDKTYRLTPIMVKMVQLHPGVEDCAIDPDNHWWNSRSRELDLWDAAANEKSNMETVRQGLNDIFVWAISPHDVKKKFHNITIDDEDTIEVIFSNE